MKNISKIIMLALVLSSAGACKPKATKILSQSDFPPPPTAQKIPSVFHDFGRERIDNYYWIRDAKDPAALQYIEQENAYTRTVMAGTEPLQEKLYGEILGMIAQSDESYPTLDNGYYYYSRTEEGKQYPVYCRKKGSTDAPEEVIFDVNEMAHGKSALLFQGFEVSPDNRLALYGYNETGSFAEITIGVRDLETGRDLDIAIPGASSMAWANDSRTFFYTTISEALRPYRVYRHVIGQEAPDALVYEEADERYNVWLEKTKTGKYIFIGSASTTTSEQRCIDADRPGDGFRVLLPRTQGVDYSFDHQGDHFIISWKDTQNPNSMLYRAPVDNYLDHTSWEVVLPHSTTDNLDGFTLQSDYIVASLTRKGLDVLKVFDTAHGESWEVEFPEAVYSVSLNGNPEYDASTVRYSYSSLNRPSTLYEYDLRSRESKVLKVQQIPSGFNPDDYVVERLWATAPDGVQVPMAIVYRKGLKKDGSNPTLIEGYGSYGVTTDAGFRRSAFSLVNRGFIYAIAQVRGGSELGEQWYEDGKFLKKKNSFTDFIAVAEKLVADGYTSPSKLAATGGSAGGLLMGAVTNMRPDLFNTIIAEVPFVDVINTMLDTSLPLTTQEYEEWGDPNDEEYFNYMLSYSPYDNVTAQDYPNMLITGGLNDSQVGFQEPTKWVAKLRELKTDDNLVLLYMNMDSGHGGATGRYDQLREIAFKWAFLLGRMGIAE